MSKVVLAWGCADGMCPPYGVEECGAGLTVGGPCWVWSLD